MRGTLIKLDSDGNIDLNGDSKRFVTHAELDNALQTFITALNSHTHGGVSSGSSATSPPVAPLSINIAAAETQTIRTGG